MDIYVELKKYFGFDEFKKGQKILIEGILNDRDVLGVMPTGGGKSLCYQLSAVLMEGITLVISPLISLMKDQVDSLDEIGIPATFINSSISEEEFNIRLEDIKADRYKILYIAPERLNTYSFLNLIGDIKISMVAVDEAHCISQWGHDFRPSYLQIPKFINSLEKRPVVSAYTATATREIVKEIKELLGLDNPLVSVTGFDRPNLFYRVVKAKDKFKYLLDYLKNNFEGQSGIIYCATRKTVESLSRKLNEKGISATGYHGGMQSEARQKNQDDFIYNRTRIIAATNAFGLGIDKPDIRFVIHYNMPKNMEAYYQEAGRAGRDGEASDCIILYSSGDIVKQKYLIQISTLSEEREAMLYQNLQYLVDYCNTNECLRNTILKYFGEKIRVDRCNNCGNCLSKSEMVDITIEAQKILSCIYRVKERFGSTVIAQILKGSRAKRILELGLDDLSTYGIMDEYRESTIKEMIMALVAMDCIYMTADKYPILRLTANSTPVLKGEIEVYHKKDLLKSIEKDKPSSESLYKEYDEGLFEELRAYRYELAQQRKIAPFIIFHDSSLKEMATYFPQDKKQFLNIKGVGIKKYESYGEGFIDIITDYAKNNEIIENKKIRNSSSKVNMDRYERTYNYYLEGLSLKEISIKRDLTSGTIIRHLERCVENGKSVDWSRFIDHNKENAILEAIEQVGMEKLRTIKEILPEEISYEDIRITILKKRN